MKNVFGGFVHLIVFQKRSFKMKKQKQKQKNKVFSALRPQGQ